VPIEYLRSRVKVGGAKRAHDGNNKAEEGTGTFVIPENLKILPSDSEEEKNRKRKKVKHLKNLFNKKKAAEEEDEKQKSWQHYLNKVGELLTGVLGGMWDGASKGNHALYRLWWLAE